jgi:phage N-6-adenine-methyltransferase
MGAKGGRPRQYATGAERAKAYRQRKRQAMKMHEISVHFKHETVVWETPKHLFEALDEEFGFTCDVCADATNAKCDRFFSIDHDGLRQRWEGVCYMNAPYGLALRRWVQKAFESSLFGTTVVCLLPVRTGTEWWQAYILPLDKQDVRYLPGRQRFGASGNSAPFSSAIVIFRPPVGR